MLRSVRLLWMIHAPTVTKKVVGVFITRAPLDIIKRFFCIK
jgi:hypothetical protein